MRELRCDALRGTLASRRGSAPATPRRGAAELATATFFVVLVVALAVVAALPPVVVVATAAGAVLCAAAFAHRTLGNVVAGLALLLARPYSPGEQVRMYAPELHAVVEAEIVRVSLVHTTMATPSGLLVVPNSRLLRAAPTVTDSGD